MKTFTIAQIERLCQIKSHTIRIWEKRYGFLHPNRNAGNVRQYSLDEVERILYVSLLNGAGVKISQLSPLNTAQLRELSVIQTEDSCITKIVVIQLIISFYTNATEDFEMLLEKAAKSLNHFSIINKIIVPFLGATDLLAYKDNAAEVHFAVTTLRRKLLVAIDYVSSAFTNDQKIVMFLPEGEHFDLILLCAYFNLKYQGFMVYYLGTNVSNETFKSVIQAKRPHHAIMYAAPTKKVKYESFDRLLNSEWDSITLTVMLATPADTDHVGRVKLTHYSALMVPIKEYV